MWETREERSGGMQHGFMEKKGGLKASSICTIFSHKYRSLTPPAGCAADTAAAHLQLRKTEWGSALLAKYVNTYKELDLLSAEQFTGR